jgi:hypothetical protein
MCFTCYSTRSGRTSFCFEFDSQREHRQKSFVHPSSSSFSALLVYGSFVGRILFLPQVFLCSALDLVSRCLCSPRLVFILGASRSASPATRGCCPFCFVGQASRLICPFVICRHRYRERSPCFRLSLSAVVLLRLLARAGAAKGVRPSPGHDFLAQSVFRARPAKVRFPRSSVVPHY